MLQALTNPTQSKMSNKFQAILASIFIGHISAMGCSPAYYPGSASYTVGTSITQSVATLNPLVWTSCSIGGVDCLTGWKKTGGVATTDTHNYVCNSLQWCNNVGYAPGGAYSDLAWTKEAVACSVSTAAHLQLKYYCYIQKKWLRKAQTFCSLGYLPFFIALSNINSNSSGGILSASFSSTFPACFNSALRLASPLIYWALNFGFQSRMIHWQASIRISNSHSASSYGQTHIP